MKRIIIILLVCISIIGALLILLFKENDILNNTSAIIVITTNDDGSIKENEIINKNNINRIIEIIDDKKGVYLEEVPYRKMPHYKLSFLDKKDSVVMEVGFFYYSEDLNWVMINDNEEYYEIDCKELLDLIS